MHANGKAGGVSRRSFLGAPAAIVVSEVERTLENANLRLVFEPRTGTLRELRNKLTGESYAISGDEFAIDDTRFSEFKLESSRLTQEEFTAVYTRPDMRVDVGYKLGAANGFAEKHVTLTTTAARELKRVVLSRPEFAAAAALELVVYKHPTFERIEAQHNYSHRRPPGTEPVRTYFGRTAKGGFFAGIEMPFDTSMRDGKRLVLSFAPNLKLRAGEVFDCEPVYLGVYRKEGAQPGEGSPLRAESEAMVRMTAAVLGPRRHRSLGAMACGWHCEFEQFTWTSEEGVEADMQSLDFLAECGVDWMTDSHPWGGETEKMNRLTGDQAYQMDTRVRRFLEHARKRGIKVVQWPTMNHTHPWWREGGPFRPDKPEWLRIPVSRPNKTFLDRIRNTKANCLANAPFFEWLLRRNFEALATGYYEGWCMDGDFWGSGAYFDTTTPVECLSEDHDHLRGDANFACQRALDRWTAAVRRRYPKMFVVMCRPPMDLGVWSQRNVDAAFTLIETGTGESNIGGGDEIRTASRIRLHHHFFPHYIDWPLLFPSYSGIPKKGGKQRTFPVEHLDYVLLSALSSSPNLLLYLPSKAGLPETVKMEIRKWLEWGRKNIGYLLVRKDLPDWPGEGKVDGSAHLAGGRGLVFLFNPNKRVLEGEFALTRESIGLERRSRVAVRQEHPAGGRSSLYKYGQSVRWPVPPESVVVLRLE